MAKKKVILESGLNKVEPGKDESENINVETEENVKKDAEENQIVEKNTVETAANQKKWYRKTGGGTLWLGSGKNRKAIKPGERFQAYPEEIPSIFMDGLVEISADGSEVLPVVSKTIPSKRQNKQNAKPVQQAPIVSVTVKYEKVPSNENDGKFNVMNLLTGKKMNDATLTDEEATALISMLKD